MVGVKALPRVAAVELASMGSDERVLRLEGRVDKVLRDLRNMLFSQAVLHELADVAEGYHQTIDLGASLVLLGHGYDSLEEAVNDT